MGDLASFPRRDHQGFEVQSPDGFLPKSIGEKEWVTGDVNRGGSWGAERRGNQTFMHCFLLPAHTQHIYVVGGRYGETILAYMSEEQLSFF